MDYTPDFNIIEEHIGGYKILTPFTGGFNVRRRNREKV